MVTNSGSDGADGSFIFCNKNGGFWRMLRYKGWKDFRDWWDQRVQGSKGSKGSLRDKMGMHIRFLFPHNLHRSATKHPFLSAQGTARSLLTTTYHRLHHHTLSAAPFHTFHNVQLRWNSLGSSHGTCGIKWPRWVILPSHNGGTILLSPRHSRRPFVRPANSAQ
jgi:hypothetical protein